MMTFMEEMRQQPQALRNFIQRTYENGKIKNQIEDLVRAKRIDRIIFTGMGSSLFASYIPANFLRQRGVMTLVAESSELLLWGGGLFTESTLIVAVSQSGESLEVLELVDRLPYPENFVAVSNYPASRLYRSANIVVDIFAGVEYLTSTKTYTNSIAGLVYLAYVLAGESDSMHDILKKSLLDCADKMDIMLSDEKSCESMANFISGVKFLLCAGSGYSYTSASHTEIVVEEAGKIFSSRYTLGQFIHGPIELIDSGFGAVVFDFEPSARRKCTKVLESILKYDGKVLLITNDTSVAGQENLLVFHIDYHDPITSPIIEIVPVEMAINRLGVMRGQNPGHLTRVAKRIAK